MAWRKILIHREELKIALQCQDTLHSLWSEAYTKATQSGCSEDVVEHPDARQSLTHNSETYKAPEAKSFLVTCLATKLNSKWHETVYDLYFLIVVFIIFLHIPINLVGESVFDNRVLYQTHVITFLKHPKLLNSKRTSGPKSFPEEGRDLLSLLILIAALWRGSYRRGTKGQKGDCPKSQLSQGSAIWTQSCPTPIPRTVQYQALHQIL